MCRGGFTMNGTKKKRLISSLVVLTLILGLFIGVRVSNTTISDDSVPLSGDQIPATFYVYNPSWQNIWTYFCDYVGEGSISEKVSVNNDAAYVNSLITSAPDYSASYPGYYIEWRAIYLMRNKTYVVGFFCDPPTTDDSSNEGESTQEVTEVDSEDVDGLVDDVIDMIEEQNPSEVLDESNEESIDSNEINQEPVHLTLTKDQLLAAKKSDYPAGSTIKYDSWNVWSGWKSGQLLSGDIKTDYMDDEVYMSMKLPCEVPIYRHNVNPVLYDYKPSGGVNALGIGAIYPVEGAVLPEHFDFYIGKLATYVLYEGSNEWVTLDSHKSLNNMYYFSLYSTPSYSFFRKLTNSEVEFGDTYTKYSLTANDFSTALLHFWGIQQPAPSQDIRALVTMYEVWTDDPNVVGKLCATIGNDQRDASGKVTQAFSGRNYAVTTDKRIVMGHNIPDDVYDELVQSGLSPEICLTKFLQE